MSELPVQTMERLIQISTALQQVTAVQDEIPLESQVKLQTGMRHWLKWLWLWC